MFLYHKTNIKKHEDGNCVEWYLPNGLGGYSSSTIINSCNRKHNGYFVASIKAPTKRILLLTKTVESIKVKNNNDYNKNKIYNLNSDNRKNGYQYLESFCYNYVPTYNYNVEGVKFTKII